MLSVLDWRFVLLGVIAMASCRHAPIMDASAPYEVIQVDTSDHAMVVSAHPLATKVGLEIMKEGGNAVDAAIAVQFALAVTYPRAGNIGGGGFMVVRDTVGHAYALDYRERAPLAAHRDMYLDALGDPIKDLSTFGYLSVGVPGTVHGMYTAWDSLGVMPTFSQLVLPAIALARDGVLINQTEADRLNKFQPMFRQLHDTTTSPFIKKEWQKGDRLVQPHLASTLSRIAEEGPLDFYEGRTAHMIVEDMKRHGGWITFEDLLDYESVWRAPIITDYRDHKVISMPPSSSGGLVLAQILTMAEQNRLSELDDRSCDYVHLLTEIERRAYADRASYLGDVDFVDVPVQRLLDANYLEEKMTDFDPSQATSSKNYQKQNSSLKLETFETTHTSVIDEQGMAVSVTTTLNTNYGSKVLVSGGGFFLNNEMDDFSIKPGVPNTYGLVGNEMNAIQPGKRMLSSMTPTIVERDGAPYLVLGSPGGSTIITSVFQVMTHMIDHGYSVEEAVVAARFHHQWLPDRILHEDGTWTAAVENCLLDRGHELGHVQRIGLVKAIHCTDEGQLIGVGDPRSDDHAEGY